VSDGVFLPAPSFNRLEVCGVYGTWVNVHNTYQGEGENANYLTIVESRVCFLFFVFLNVQINFESRLESLYSLI
jgi:hypothetical protein